MCRFPAPIHVIIAHLPIISNTQNVHISGLFIGRLPIKTRLLTPREVILPESPRIGVMLVL